MIENDPLPRFRAELKEAGVLTEELEAQIAAEVKTEIDEATDYAENAPDPIRRHGHEVGLRRGLAGRDATGMGLRRRARHGRPRGRHERRRSRGRLMALKTFIEAIRETMLEEMRRDEAVILLGEDVGLKGGVFLATDGLFAEFGGDRVIDTPLTESQIIGDVDRRGHERPSADRRDPVRRLHPPAFNQLVSEAARMRYRSNNGFGVPMTVRAPYGGGVHGALYHSQSVEAFFAHVPGLKVVIPSTPYDAAGLLRSSIRDDDPVLFFEHKKMYRSVRGDVPTGDYLVPLGKAAITHPGTQITVIAYGLMAHYALEAADVVAEEGISVEVVDLRTLRPLDKETVLSSVRKTGKCLVVYEDNRFLGYGAEICSIVAEEAFDYLDGPVTRIAGPDVPGVPYNHVLEDWFMVNPEKIADGIRKLAAYQATPPRSSACPRPPTLYCRALRLRAILDPYREHLVEDAIYHMPILRRKGAKKHDWFAGVQPVEGR